MSALPRLTAVLLVLLAALVQVSIGHRVEIANASPDLLILVVVSCALLGGSIEGAALGFLAGIALAVFGAVPMGTHALVATLLGFAAGRVGEVIVTDDHPAPPLVAGMVAAAGMQVGVPLVEFLVNPAVTSVDGLWSSALLVTALSAVLAVPAYLVVRRVLASATAAAGGSAAPIGEVAS